MANDSSKSFAYFSRMCPAPERLGTTLRQKFPGTNLVKKMMSATKLVYQSDSYKKEHQATVLLCQPSEAKPGFVNLVCDETILYPQGGGQPTDIGSMASKSRPEISGEVKFVSYDRATGVVSHEVMMRGPDPFAASEQVNMEIDWDKRYLHMRLHSGGHLIDHAVQFLECPFRAIKASHFPSGPAVEFQVLDTVAFPTDRPSLDKFQATLQSKCDELLAKDMSVLVFEEGTSGESGSAVAATHEQKVAEVQASKVRMVLFEGCPAAVPCGGTHVARVGEIGRVLIKKVAYKDAVLRISYRLDLS